MAELFELVGRARAEGTQGYDVYLRTAVDVGTEGWAISIMSKCGIRWGIFLMKLYRTGR